MFCATAVPQSVDYVAWSITAGNKEQFGGEEHTSSVLVRRIDHLHISDTYYRFTKPILVNQAPDVEGWVCYADDLTQYVGRGATPEQAHEDFGTQLHTEFQVLHRMRPFEMSGNEHLKWIQLTSIIDLLHYRTTTPITTYEIGQVSFEQIARPYHIDWISGEWRYQIEPNKVPAELMSCRPSQWIEAVVLRDPTSYRISEIKSIRKISFRVPSDSELRLAWESMPEAELKPGEWVW